MDPCRPHAIDSLIQKSGCGDKSVVFYHVGEIIADTAACNLWISCFSARLNEKVFDQVNVSYIHCHIPL